jgi:hypothetical protein
MNLWVLCLSTIIVVGLFITWYVSILNKKGGEIDNQKLMSAYAKNQKRRHSD